MTVLLYLGSFNPVHFGHLSIVRHLCGFSELDEIRLILSPKNPLKKVTDLADATQRFSDLTHAIQQAGHQGFFPDGKLITVSKVEFPLPQPLYTLHTLQYLQVQEPENDFILMMGGDNISSIEKWYHYEELLQEFRVWVYPRLHVEEEKTACLRLSEQLAVKEIRFLEGAPLFPISSTSIRAGLAQQWSEDLSALDAPK